MDAAAAAAAAATTPIRHEQQLVDVASALAKGRRGCRDRSRWEKARAEIEASRVHVGRRADAGSTLPTQGPRVRETGDRRRRIQTCGLCWTCSRRSRSPIVFAPSIVPSCAWSLARSHRNNSCTSMYVQSFCTDICIICIYTYTPHNHYIRQCACANQRNFGERHSTPCKVRAIY